MSVVNNDLLDEGLQAVMGKERCQNECDWQTAKKPIVEEKKVQNTAGKAVDAPWEPVRPEPNWMDNLKACAKAVLLFGGLSCLIFYWQQAGLMAESIAVPSMCICTALAGWGAGRNIRGNR